MGGQLQGLNLFFLQTGFDYDRKKSTISSFIHFTEMFLGSKTY